MLQWEKKTRRGKYKQVKTMQFTAIKMIINLCWLKYGILKTAKTSKSLYGGKEEGEEGDGLTIDIHDQNLMFIWFAPGWNEFQHIFSKASQHRLYGQAVQCAYFNSISNAIGWDLSTKCLFVSGNLFRVVCIWIEIWIFMCLPKMMLLMRRKCIPFGNVRCVAQKWTKQSNKC